MAMVFTSKSERNLRGSLAPFEVAIYSFEIAGLSRYHYYPPTTIDPGKWTVKRQLSSKNGGTYHIYIYKAYIRAM